MENQPQPPIHEAADTNGLARRIAGAFIASIRFIGNQLATADLNPHEGKLRASAMPTEYMHIPDQPPIHDDTV